ncbi:MAG: acetoin utilization protein AcuC [Verrucomicrobiae bacterium]|nr:acetoin utilization protein AcuC [Verrucomicrobiae bacterium]
MGADCNSISTPVLMYSEELAALSYPPDCPFKTSRAVELRRQIRSLGLVVRELPARPATRAELERFHRSAYLDELQRAAAGELRVEGLHMGLGTPETPVFRDLWSYAVWAAGASLRGVELLLSGEATVVFNPWGGFHHAMADRASGFCYVNDIVLACDLAAAAGKRVLCLDVDAHHGDGQQTAFYRRRDVLTISLHESGKTLFPWGGFEDEIGEGEGRGFNVNIPVPAETYDEAYLTAFYQAAWPVIRGFHGDLIVLELGMDALAGDPLTHLRLSNNVFAEIVGRLRDLRVPMLVTGGGGYHEQNTVRGWTLAWQVLCGDDGHDWSAGFGGDFLESSEWIGGLRDRTRPPTRCGGARNSRDDQSRASSRFSDARFAG